MKTIKLLFIAALMNMSYASAQITFDYAYPANTLVSTVKLSLSGVKYCYTHAVGNNPIIDYFVLYNTDHSVFRTINIPQVPNFRTFTPNYISETLFNLDTLIEYAVTYQDSTTGIGHLRILNETGNVLMIADSATLPNIDIMYPIFYDGTQTKMVLTKMLGVGVWCSEVYNLPGYLTCVECNNGIVDAIAPPHENHAHTNQSLAYPNPATEFIKIKYELPRGYRHAVVNLLDITGKLIKQKQIGEHFNEIYISTEEINQGAYIYQVVIDGKVTTSGKVIKL